MEFIIFFAFVVIFTACVKADIPKEKDENHNKIIAECRTDFKITDEEYTKLRLGKVTKPDENMQCLANCVMEKLGAIKDGKIQADEVTKILIPKVGAEKAKKILESCRGESGSGKCGTAHKLHECLLQNEAY